jgi:hypothetical protein
MKEGIEMYPPSLFDVARIREMQSLLDRIDFYEKEIGRVKYAVQSLANLPYKPKEDEVEQALKTFVQAKMSFCWGAGRPGKNDDQNEWAFEVRTYNKRILDELMLALLDLLGKEKDKLCNELQIKSGPV